MRATTIAELLLLIALGACAVEEDAAREIVLNPKGKADGRVGMTVYLTEGSESDFFFDCDRCDAKLEGILLSGASALDASKPFGTLDIYWGEEEPYFPDNAETYEMHLGDRSRVLFHRVLSPDWQPDVAVHALDHTRFWIRFANELGAPDTSMVVYASWN